MSAPSQQGRIGAGLAHTCAISSRGEVRCWGFAATGRLGYANADLVAAKMGARRGCAAADRGLSPPPLP